jgi:7-keto-8-aminopelargonate synthetase-like enzyme
MTLLRRATTSAGADSYERVVPDGILAVGLSDRPRRGAVGQPVVPPKVLANRTIRGPISARMNVDGREYINFFGVGYLALSRVPEIRTAVLQALNSGVPFFQHVPAAHGAVDPIFDAVERAGALALGTEASVYFASGYLIGAAGLAAIEEPFDVILLDEHAHFSLQDAARSARSPHFTFAHCNAQSLADALQRHLKPKHRPLVLTDGAFATTGRIPPLRDYAAVLARYDGRLYIDEAHAFGVVGPHGRGAGAYCGVEDICSSGATLGKAYCAQGAIIGCSASTARRLRTIPPIGGACAGSPLSAAAATASLEYVAKHEELRDQLRETGEYFRARLRQIGLEVLESPAPIVAFQYGSSAQMRDLQRRLFDRGIYIHYSTYIGAGSEGIIRCAVYADHSFADIDELVAAVR